MPATAWKIRRAEGAFASARFPEAAEIYGEILASRDAPVLRVKRGVALWEGGSRKEGLAEAREGAKALPAGHPVRLFLALLLIEEGFGEEAAGIVRAVQTLDPSNLFARGLTALGRLASGKWREAEKALEEGVFGSPLFRAHLLVGVEKHLKRVLSADEWTAGYLEMVL